MKRALFVLLCLAAPTFGRDDPVGNSVTFTFNSPTAVSSASLGIGTDVISVMPANSYVDSGIDTIAGLISDETYRDVVITAGAHELVVPDILFGDLPIGQVTGLEFKYNYQPLASGWVYNELVVTWFGVPPQMGSAIPEPGLLTSIAVMGFAALRRPCR